jgi:hypothetical protein
MTALERAAEQYPDRYHVMVSVYVPGEGEWSFQRPLMLSKELVEDAVLSAPELIGGIVSEALTDDLKGVRE